MRPDPGYIIDMKRIALLSVLFLATAIVAGPAPAPAHDIRTGLSGAHARLMDAAADAGVAYPLRNPVIGIWKEERVLALFARDASGSLAWVKSYWCGLGWNPVGHKLREGDGKTPEGEYYICSQNGASQFHKFLGISYPSPADADLGYYAGRIGPSTRQRVKNVRSPNRPPWNTALGGAIGIHGGGGWTDWTLGCIALEDDEVDEIWIATELGSRVYIFP